MKTVLYADTDNTEVIMDTKTNIKDIFSNVWTIPNLLSFLRIIMVPIFAVLFLKGTREGYIWSVVVLALSGLSDFFDGKIARRFNQISALGKLLDPLADKLTQITIAVVFFITFSKSDDSVIHAFSYVFIAFLVKEAIMVVGSVIMIAMGLRPGAAEMPGKVATFAFYLIMISMIAFGKGIEVVNAIAGTTNLVYPTPVMIVLVVISLILTLIAFFSYIPSVKEQLKQRKEKKANESEK